jgi:hypothetical protein
VYKERKLVNQTPINQPADIGLLIFQSILGYMDIIQEYNNHHNAARELGLVASSGLNITIQKSL